MVSTTDRNNVRKPMPRARTPIPGWNEEEVVSWLRQFRGSARQCVGYLLPHLEGAEKNRAVSRVNYVRTKLKADGLDFSNPREPSVPRATIHALPPPAPRPEPPPATVEVAQVDMVTPSAMDREALLAWAVDRAAVAVDQTPPDRGAYASNLNTLVRAHAELAELRAQRPEEELDISALVDMLKAQVDAVPMEVLELCVAEYLRRHPKARISA
jgi:hypothetical protein